jgi:hypothetical protein
MTEEQPEQIAKFNLDDEPDGELPSRSYWWSLHRPETYALASFALAFTSLFALGAAQDLIEAISYGISPHEQKTGLLIVCIVRLGVSLIALLGAGLSIRDEDDDTTWSPPVARAALLLAGLAALFTIAAMIIIGVTSSSPNDFGG